MKLKSNSAFTLLEIMIVLAIIGILAASVIPNLTKAIATARARTCAINRKQIDGAKIQWAAEHNQPPTATPTDADLFGLTAYIEHKPDCPARGDYTLNAVQAKCACSAFAHEP